MAYLEFDKSKLVNLSYSLTKELVRANKRGSYASTTLSRCNTRKYHGLLITPQPAIDDELHVLLSSVDPTIIQKGAEFHLGIHRYPHGVYAPKGHKYMRELHSDPIPKITYRVGGVVFSVETLLSTTTDRVLIRYTLEDAHSPTKIRLQPFLAFRERHSLSKANVFANTKFEKVANGAKFRMYQGYTPLYMQFSKETEYVHIPNWYNNIEYLEELNRGYEFKEDLFVPGYFEFSMKKGESVILSAGVEEAKPSGLKRAFANEMKNRIPRDSFRNALLNAAGQFIQKRNGKTEIIAGFPWFGRWGRDTFIALPGLTLSTGNPQLCKNVLDTMSAELKGPLFPNIGSNNDAAYNSIDAPLWYFWAIQQYTYHTKKYKEVWKRYGKKMKMILEGYRKGTSFNIRMNESGLVSGGEPGVALTWMDAVAGGKPVTPRTGMQVEINALWYNAMMFMLELADKFDDKKFIKEWQHVADRFPSLFVSVFWDKEKGYLADYADKGYKDWAIRPNMIFAASLPYSPIDDAMKKSVVDVVKGHLLTTRGLRTLSPKHPDYQGVYGGDQMTRDRQYHQGTVWPWLFGHFVEAYLKIYGKSGVQKMKWYCEQFENTMTEDGIGTISEIYDGDPPHHAKGAISQAWSVAEVLRAQEIINQYENK